MKILVVDDDPIILDVSTLMLERIGYDDVHTADGAEAALEALGKARLPFGCILLDINMPRVSGIELIPQIRALDGYASVPIIMTTSLESPRHVSASFIAGAWDYLVKPFEVFDLESRMHAAELHHSETARWQRSPADGSDGDAPLPGQVAQTSDNAGQAGGRPAGLVSPIAFENCLLQLQPNAEARVEVRALRVTGMAEITAEIGARGMRSYLPALVDIVVQTVAGPRDLVSYQGGGVFLILSSGPRDNGLPQLDLEAQAALADLDAEFLDGTGLQTRIGFGVARQEDQPADVWPLELISQAVADLPG